MTSDHQNHIRNIPRRKRKLVALVLQPNRYINEEAQIRGWKIVNLFYSPLPEGVIPLGALADILPDKPSVLELLNLGIPVVRLGNLPHPDDLKIPAVLPDLSAQGALASDHFFERGFRDVGYFGRDPWSDAQELFEGFNRRANEQGMRCHLHRLKENPLSSEKERKKRKRQDFIAWLRAVPKPFGLLCPGEWIAAVQCTWAAQAGFDVPSDIAVLASGSSFEISESTMPTLSTIMLNEKGRIHAACDILDSMMAGACAPKSPIMIPPAGVIERESTNVLATPDRAVATALRYMWDHIDLDLSVESIGEAVGMSSRQLARHFKQALGRTITEELRRKRLHDLKVLLRSTNIPIAELAPMVGFRSTTYLHHTFREAFGITPLQYRRKTR